MALTRAQYVAGDESKGALLPNQPQGVKEGPGVSIASDGTISFDSTSALGVIKTNNPLAFNSYVWPAATVDGGQPIFESSDSTIRWGRVPGYGLIETANNLRVQTKVSPTPPAIGTGNLEAPEGGLYWNSESGVLFINYLGTWTQASYGPLDLNEALLTGTYTLYVNPQIGSDEYVTGVYDPGATPTVTNQMTVAGYTPQRPFKTIARAALEVARIQNGSGFDALAYDRYVIKCSAGEHVVDNGVGSASVSEWVDGLIPDSDDLKALNSSTYPGVILPRGVSIIGEDLRKTVIRPSFVPSKTGNIETDRGSIFRVTGGAFFFGFTFKDKSGYNESHHLLDCFSYASDSDLELYYAKTQDIFAQSYVNLPVNPGETEIVAPQPPGTPEEDTDGVFGASPYIFNCSIRSKYGLCGINGDGSDVTGFKSIVTAQFTGVSLQRDLTCWEKYNPGSKTWTSTIVDYDEYISLNPNNVRMRPDRKSFHIRAINNAFIQEVSVFAIGQGVHHWVKAGGELSITNSNSSFGGCAALAEGYKTESFPQDSNWNVASINVATNMQGQTTIVSTIAIGIVANSVANDATTIVLTQPLGESEIYPGEPHILASRSYSFKAGSYLWIENPAGPDWRAPLTASAWDPDFPNQVTITVEMENQDGDTPGQDAFTPNLAGSRVYIRRLSDNRTTNQRKYSVNVTNTSTSVRTPQRDYVLQTSTGGGGGVVGLIPDTYMTVLNQAGPIPVGSDPVLKKCQVVLGRSNPSSAWTASSFYRPGDTVRYQNKHFTCVVKNKDSTFNPEKWDESYVHMSSSYNAYDFSLTIAPVIYFDNDTDGNQPTTTCGFNLSTCWDLPEIRGQYTTSTDYRGVWYFLIGIGFTSEEAYEILKPRAASTRELDPSNSADMGGYIPDGAANDLGNWPVEFRRPSVLRMFGHAWEWAGFLNYTKAIPQYQGDLSAQNQFNYYFTNELGGRVYATGFNQEGYFVTASGLTDLSTGATTGVADLGNPFAGVDIPTYYPYLKVDNLEITTNVDFTDSNLSGTPTFEGIWYTNFRQSSSTDSGIIRIATEEEAAALSSSTTAITPATLSLTLSSAIKQVVNLRLSLSSSSPVPNSNQLGSTSIYIHPYGGSEIALYDTMSLSWQVVPFSGVLSRSLSSASSPETNYDVYIYNSGTLMAPDLQLSFVSWSGPQSPPSRDNQNGVLVRDGYPNQRLVAVMRTTAAGTSTYDLGGLIYGADSANYPRLYLSNLYNSYDASARYFFGNYWDVTAGLSGDLVPPPTGVYPVNPRVAWVQASPSLATAYMDVYNNWGIVGSPNPVIAYVGAGIDGTTYTGLSSQGETQSDNSTATTYWAQSLGEGLHEVFYLYKVSGTGLSRVNEHPFHGTIMTVKV